jgi:uncharacterized protein YbjT (DUF2867 family)
LACQGYAVRGVSRRPFHRGLLHGEHVYLDIACATRIESWLPLLDGIDAVVNCAGTLQDSPFESTRGVHVNGIGALLTACQRQGLRRYVHLSAIGVDKGRSSMFSRTKLEAEALITHSRTREATPFLRLYAVEPDWSLTGAAQRLSHCRSARGRPQAMAAARPSAGAVPAAAKMREMAAV